MTHASLHVDVHPGDGPPMLMVHGLMAGRELWSANIDALRAVVTPVVVELYGHGRSPRGLGDDLHRPARYVAEFERIRADLGVERWFVTGQSLGAGLTVRYALDHPDRVLGQVITNSVSALAERVGTDEGIDAAARHTEDGGIVGLRNHRLNPARARRIVSPVRDALAADLHLIDPAAVAAAMRFTSHGGSSRGRLHLNTVPTLLVAGELEEAFVEPTHFAEQHMPMLEVVRVADAGHSPNAEAPDAFNAAVIGFVRRVLGSSESPPDAMTT